MSWKELANASKNRRGAADALALAKQMDRVVAAKGKNVITFDMKQSKPDDDTLLKHLVAPSGNLRAPAFRIGKTLVVGFNEEAYRNVLAE